MSQGDWHGAATGRVRSERIMRSSRRVGAGVVSGRESSLAGEIGRSEEGVSSTTTSLEMKTFCVEGL